MSHRALYLVLAVLLTGCVPVTEPLSDPDKATPDRRLLGHWQQVANSGRYEIDALAVKGNPRGLMRAVFDGKPADPLNTFWFFPTTIGKHTYATIFLDPVEGLQFADFRTEGAFAKWHKGDKRQYFIFRYVLAGNDLTVDGGAEKAVKKLMADENIKGKEYFATPPGWLAKYLEKTGPDTIYNGKNAQRLRRVVK